MIMDLRRMLNNPDGAMGKKGDKGKDTKDDESSDVKGNQSLDVAKSRAATPERKTPEGEHAPMQLTSSGGANFISLFEASLQRNMSHVSTKQDHSSDEGGHDPERLSSPRKGKGTQPPEEGSYQGQKTRQSLAQP